MASLARASSDVSSISICGMAGDRVMGDLLFGVERTPDPDDPTGGGGGERRGPVTPMGSSSSTSSKPAPPPATAAVKRLLEATPYAATTCEVAAALEAKEFR